MTSAHFVAAGERGIAAVELLVHLIWINIMDSQAARSLTILIPTFDRPDEVNGRLREIEALWGSAAIVHVQVNPGKHSAAEIDRSLFSGQLTIRENPSNIGFVGNVVVGLQSIATEWLWILGDDDILISEARSRIEEAMRLCDETAANAAVFNHWFKSPHAEPVICRDLESFAAVTGFGDTLFITGTIWRTRHFRSHLEDFVVYAYTFSSQILPLFISLIEGRSPVVVLSQPIIEWRSIIRWSRLEYLDQVLILLRHPVIRPVAGKVYAFMWPLLLNLFRSAMGQVRSGEVTFSELVRVYGLHLGYALRHRPSLLVARDGILAWPLRRLWRLGG